MSRNESEPSDVTPTRRRNFLGIGIAIAAVIVIAISAFMVLSGSRDDIAGPHLAGQTPPDVVSLAGPLASQKLVWEECEFNDDGPPLPGADVSNVECATIKVPRNWLNPALDETWDVRISQAHNIDASDPDYHTTILSHPGGPYTSGLSFSTARQC